MGKKKDKAIEPRWLQYCRSVVSGEIIACKYVKLACERALYDRETASKRELIFIQPAADRLVSYYSKLCHVKGKLAGTPLKLEPWQEFCISQIGGWYRFDGTRRFRYVYLELPRKNGKTTLAAPLGLYFLDCDGEAGAEVYAVATKKDQAKIAWQMSAQMVKKNPVLSKRIKVTRTTLTMWVEDSDSIFTAMASDADTMDGLNPSFTICDEMHAWKGTDLWGVMETGQASREQPLMFGITTAGFNQESIAYENRRYLIQILEGFSLPEGIKDDAWFGLIFCADEGDNWESEATWKKANPNYGISGGVSKIFLETVAKKAKKQPKMLRHFKCKHLNLWVNEDKNWLNMEDWALCPRKLDLELLKKRTCYGGMDLSKRLDLTAFALFFPAEPEKGFKDNIILVKCYVPEDQVDDLEDENKAPYKHWVEQGYLTATPGAIVDYGFIEEDIKQFAKDYNLIGICYDPYNATNTSKNLQAEGIQMIECRQGYKTMSEPSKDFECMVVKHNLNHLGNPVFRWAASNVVCRSDHNDNYMPAKNKSRGRIDPITAAVMAITCSKLNPEPEKSIYETRGVSIVS